MPLNDIVAPSLSTAQDEATFSYSKIDKTEIKRNHLNLQPGETYSDKINDYYSIDEIVAFLKQTNEDGSPKFKRITLQFPDSLVCDAAAVAQTLQARLGLDVMENSYFKQESGGDARSKAREDISTNEDTQRLWILADTSYSSCCVDEVAAEHVHADLLLHFGDACLNSVSRLACAYVFGRPFVDEDKLIEKFVERFPEEEFAESKIALMADAPHTYVLELLVNKLRGRYHGLIYGDVLLEDNSTATIIGYKTGGSLGLRALNRRFAGVEGTDETLQEYELFHITKPQTPRLLQLTTKFQSVTVFEPSTNSTSQGPYPNLMRRYRYMHMARSAGTIGVLVNTLSLSNTRELIKGVGAKLKEAGKKHYVFVVGKPNVAKLANFDAIDLWCILGCDHQGIIIDQTNEFFKPIVTPYELLLALSEELTWTRQWVTDFKSILSEIGDGEVDVDNDADKPDAGHDSEDEAPEFDPVTGQYVSTARPLRRLQHLSIGDEDHENTNGSGESNSLVKKLSGAVALRNTVSTSAAHLQSRQWTGLGSDYQDDVDPEGAIVEEGGSGIARGYDFDRVNAKSL